MLLYYCLFQQCQPIIAKIELEKLGLKVIKKAWNSLDFNWSETKFAVFRSTWDYFDKFKEFKIWLEKVKEETTFINTYELINWNLDKKYLIELNKKGIVPSAADFGLKVSLSDTSSVEGDSVPETVPPLPAITGIVSQTQGNTAPDTQDTFVPESVPETQGTVIPESVPET